MVDIIVDMEQMANKIMVIVKDMVTDESNTSLLLK